MSDLTPEQHDVMSEVTEVLTAEDSPALDLSSLSILVDMSESSNPDLRKKSRNSPLHVSGPLVEIRRPNQISVQQGNTPLNRSRSNSHSSLSILGDTETSVSELLTETSSALNRMVTVPVDESSHPVTQESPSPQSSSPLTTKLTPPPSPLPSHLMPHSRSSSGRYSKVNKSTHSPSPRKRPSSYSPTKTSTSQRRNKSRESNSNSLLSSLSRQSSKNTSPVKTTFAGPVDIQACVNAVCIVPMGKDENIGALVLSASSDGTVRLLNAVSGRVTRSYEGLLDRALCVDVSMPMAPSPCVGTNGEGAGEGEETRIVAAGSRGGVCLWDFHSGSLLHAIETEVTVWGVTLLTPSTTARLSDTSNTDTDDCRWDPDQNHGIVLGSCSDGMVRAWRIDTGEMLRPYEVHEDSVLCIAAFVSQLSYPEDVCAQASHDPIIATGGSDFLVHLWEYPSGNVHHILSGHADDVTSVCIVEEDMDTLRVISGSRDRSVRVWDVKSGTCLATLTGHTDIICGVCGIVGNVLSCLSSNSPRGSYGFFGKERGSDSNTGDLSESADGSIGDIESNASETSDSTLGRTESTGKHLALPQGLRQDASLIVASCSADGSVCLWDVLHQKPIVTSRLHKDVVKGVSVAPVMVKASPDGDVTSTIMLTSCSWDKTVMFYKLDSMMSNSKGANRCTVS